MLLFDTVANNTTLHPTQYSQKIPQKANIYVIWTGNSRALGKMFVKPKIVILRKVTKDKIDHVC